MTIRTLRSRAMETLELFRSVGLLDEELNLVPDGAQAPAQPPR